MKKILIATTNPGKFKEFITEFADLGNFIQFVDLKAVGLDKTELEEPHETTWENALHKAKFFAQKSRLITIAEDSGVFVDYLHGAPGVKTKRNASTEKDRLEWILKALKNVPKHLRGIQFQTSACLYDPHTDHRSMFQGKVSGFVTEKITKKWRPGMEHDAIFYYPPAKKTFVEMSVEDKNLVSHRGKVLFQLRNFLSRQYGAKQLVVACGLLVKNRKLLLLKRRDPRPDFNNKWEFPGGGVEVGETVEECLHREIEEETGFKIKILEHFPTIYSASRGEKDGNFQVFLPLFICKAVSGKIRTSDTEAAGSGWFTLRESLKLDFLPLNKKIIHDNLTLLKKYID